MQLIAAKQFVGNQKCIFVVKDLDLGSVRGIIAARNNCLPARERKKDCNTRLLCQFLWMAERAEALEPAVPVPVKLKLRLFKVLSLTRFKSKQNKSTDFTNTVTLAMLVYRSWFGFSLNDSVTSFLTKYSLYYFSFIYITWTKKPYCRVGVFLQCSTVWEEKSSSTNCWGLSGTEDLTADTATLCGDTTASQSVRQTDKQTEGAAQEHSGGERSHLPTGYVGEKIPRWVLDVVGSCVIGEVAELRRRWKTALFHAGFLGFTEPALRREQ